MSNNIIKRFLATAATMVTLGSSLPSVANPVASSKTPTKESRIDTHEQDRATFLENYTGLNLDFEGDFPAIYWDHGNIAAPGGVKLDTNSTITVRKITSLDGSRIPVVSYKAKDQKNMQQMAEGVLPKIYKEKFKIDLVKLKVGTLNKNNIPAYGDTSFTNTVFYVPSAQRKQYHDQAVKDHLKVAEDLFGADYFYNLPLARQIAIVDMIYPLKKKFSNTTFYQAVSAKKWDGPSDKNKSLTNKKMAIREAWTSKEERGDVDKNGDPIGIPPRRYAVRRLLLEYGSTNLLPEKIPSVEKIAESLPPGETKLANLTHRILSITATNNQQRVTTVAAFNTQKGLEK